MAKTASYGIGQYTYDPKFEYISKLNVNNIKDILNKYTFNINIIDENITGLDVSLQQIITYYI